MMKITKAVLTMLMLVAFLPSCVREDLSDCHSINYLLLSYVGDGEDEIFNDMIDKVDIYIFNSDNRLVKSYTLPEADVRARKTMLPQLEEGNYRIVCLGNTYHTVVSGLPTRAFGNDITFSDKDYTESRTVKSNDPLYFSSLDYEIEPFDAESPSDNIRTAVFRCSHYDVMIQVIGAPDTRDLPKIEMTGLLPSTDFTNKARGEEVTYIPETQYSATNATMSSSFNIMRHTAHDRVNVSVTDTDGATLATVNLAEFLAANADKIDVTKQEVLIPIEIRFFSGQVIVQVPSWFVEEIRPDSI